MTTTTDHIKALLVDDGREFAMIRKTDLAALMQIAETDPHQGRFLDPIGAHKAEIKRLELEVDGFRKLRFKSDLIAFKHGGERRRYMANNKALLATVEGLQDSLCIEREAHLWADHYLIQAQQDHIKTLGREAHLESQLLRVARFKRKFPSIGRIMDLTP